MIRSYAQISKLDFTRESTGVLPMDFPIGQLVVQPENLWLTRRTLIF
jgi:hypothetical protein